jgi:hypothetical protein
MNPGGTAADSPALLNPVFRSGIFAAGTIQNLPESFPVGALDPLREEFLCLQGGDLLGGGNYQKLIHAGPVLIALCLYGSLQ